ncbi:MAG: hypothetical protein JF619_22310 [Massilia sp.]|nr:hypothetical protein [Massilia sp.]
MYSSIVHRSALSMAALCACAGAHATRPMVVDDASITSPGNCQVETWTQRTPNQTEYWALPACNVGGTWELAAGLGRIGPDGPGEAYRSGIVQAKTVFHPLAPNGWGVGLTIASQFRQGEEVAGDLSVLVPVSVSLLDDRVLAHANLGWLRARAAGHGGAIWAAGAEWSVQPRLTLTLEAYGTVRDHGFTQAGVRYTLVPDRLAIDAGLGSRIGHPGAERYVTVGLTLAGPVLR